MHACTTYKRHIRTQAQFSSPYDQRNTPKTEVSSVSQKKKKRSATMKNEGTEGADASVHVMHV